MPRLFKKWDRTVKFRELLSDDTNDLRAQRVGLEISRRVDIAIPEDDKLRDDDLTEIIERFQEVVNCDDLNDCLEDLYDWGDRDRRLFVAL